MLRPALSPAAARVRVPLADVRPEVCGLHLRRPDRLGGDEGEVRGGLRQALRRADRQAAGDLPLPREVDRVPLGAGGGICGGGRADRCSGPAPRVHRGGSSTRGSAGYSEAGTPCSGGDDPGLSGGAGLGPEDPVLRGLRRARDLPRGSLRLDLRTSHAPLRGRGDCGIHPGSRDGSPGSRSGTAR